MPSHTQPSPDEGSFTIELTHERLATQWPRYQTWLQSDAPDKRVHDELADRARRWVSASAAIRARDLISGLQLERTEALARLWPRWMSLSERALLDASLRRREKTGSARRAGRQDSSASPVLLLL